MFFLLPDVTAVMLCALGVLLVWRVFRQRHAPRPAPRRRRRRSAPDGRSLLVPAALLRGADRTWVVFTTPRCRTCRQVAERLRTLEPGSHVALVDATREPRLVEAHGVGRLPAVLLANRYGQVEARLVGLEQIEGYAAEIPPCTG